MEEARKHSVSDQSIEFHRMQLVEIGERLLVRIFVSPEAFHEYSLPLHTTLAQALLHALEAGDQNNVNHPGSNQTQ